MVDSSDIKRIGTSQEEFHAILQEEELKDALLLIYANKQVHGATHRKPQFVVTSKLSSTYLLLTIVKNASGFGMHLTLACY